MSTHPTHRVTFDPAALTDDQRDGFTCVVCSADLATGGPSVPVGIVPGGLQLLGGQVFACTSHVQDATGGERDDAETRERAARRATWPGGEPAEVRDLAERTQRQAEANDGLSRDFADDGDADMSRVFADVARAFREAATALESGRDAERAVMLAEAAVKRARTALDARTAR